MYCFRHSRLFSSHTLTTRSDSRLPRYLPPINTVYYSLVKSCRSPYLRGNCIYRLDIIKDIWNSSGQNHAKHVDNILKKIRVDKSEVQCLQYSFLLRFLSEIHIETSIETQYTEFLERFGYISLPDQMTR